MNFIDMNVNVEGKLFSELRIIYIFYLNDGKWLVSVDEWQLLDNDVDNVSGDQKEQFMCDRFEVFLKFWEVKDDGFLVFVLRINSLYLFLSLEKVLDLVSSFVVNCFVIFGVDVKLCLWWIRMYKGCDIVVREQVDMILWVNFLVVFFSDMVSEDVMIENEDNLVLVFVVCKGCIEFLEDGFIFFVVYGMEENGVVNIIDVVFGDVIDSIEGFWKGDLRVIGVVLLYFIVFFDEFWVFDIVSDELRYVI